MIKTSVTVLPGRLEAWIGCVLWVRWLLWKAK